MTYPQDFEQFWATYPKGCRQDGCGSLQGGKKEAYKAWLGLDADEKKIAMTAVEILKKHQFLPHASRWLRAGMYETVMENQAVTKRAKRKCIICSATDVAMSIDGKGCCCWRDECKVEYAKL